MRCGTIRHALCANKRPNSSRHVAQEAQCARPRCAKAPSRRPGHGGCLRLANVPHLARRRAAGERSAGRVQKYIDDVCHLTCPNIRHLILNENAPRPTKGRNYGLPAWAQIYASSSWRYIWGSGRTRENRNQTIKCRTKVKESIPLVNTTIPDHPEKASKQSKIPVAYR